MKDKDSRNPSREQLAFPEFKTRDGESVIETNKRMNEFISETLEKNEGKRIAIVSHGGAIKFFLLNYCNVNDNLNLEYNGKELEITSPCLLKLTIRNGELIDLEQKGAVKKSIRKMSENFSLIFLCKKRHNH